MTKLLDKSIDAKHWNVKFLPLPKRFPLASGAGFCGSVPTGFAEGRGTQPHWWPEGNAASLAAGKEKLQIAASSADSEIVGHRVLRLGTQAILWRIGKTNQWTIEELHPPAMDDSTAKACGGGAQVGFGTTNRKTRALCWTGTASSVIELWGPGQHGSLALGTDGTTQVGRYDPGENRTERACLWKGSSKSFVDLHPTSGGRSEAVACDGGTQCGHLFTGGGPHAALWRGTARSFVDLTPAAFPCAEALACRGAFQCGFVKTELRARTTRAALWAGSSAEFFDLHSLLPAEWNDSIATAVSIHDGKLAIVGTARVRKESGLAKSQAVLWEVPLR